MSPSVPPLNLSHGQVLWCLAGGHAPVPPLPHQVRYLRQRGIPFDESVRGQGRGVRLTYDFYELIEVGVAFEALRQRMEPRLLEGLVDDRKRYREVYRLAYSELAPHPSLFAGDPRSRSIFGNEIFIRFGDRYSAAPGKVTFAASDQNPSAWKFGDLVEEVDGPGQVVIPLKSLVLYLIRLAEVAPQTRPGPRG